VPQVRFAAVRAVARVAAHPGALLAAAAEDEDRLVRLEVARQMAGLPEHCAKALLEDPDVRVSEAAAGAVRRLCDELASERTERRRATAYALARLGARDVAPVLSRLANDPDPDVRLALVQESGGPVRQPGACDALSQHGLR